jgi:pilus assembly protein CpaF
LEDFHLESYLSEFERREGANPIDFSTLCKQIRDEFMGEWETEGDYSKVLELQKKAIIGYENEVAYFKQKINLLIEKFGAGRIDYPNWYECLADGVYHENWGMAGIAEWFGAGYDSSSSAKIIGDRIYFMHEGSMKLMPQQISKERRDQLIRAFLLLTPEERLDKDFHEVYLLDGTRITVFRGAMTKKDQDVIIFRRYIVPRYNFEEQAARGTIPKEAIPLFESMVELGYNTVFTGAVRTAKSTFLSTWQSYENPNLEGVIIETDPEIPMERLMPKAPIVQVLADGEKLSSISKNLLRSDGDYIIMAEARDGVALELAMRMAAKGTRRMKMTFHTGEPMDFPYDAAWEIIKVTGGSLELIAKKMAGCFDYIFHFIQLKDKNQKRLRGIYEMSLDGLSGEICIERICTYDYAGDTWQWKYVMGKDKEERGIEESRTGFQRFSDELENLSRTYPMGETKDA